MIRVSFVLFVFFVYAIYGYDNELIENNYQMVQEKLKLNKRSEIKFNDPLIIVLKIFNLNSFSL